MKARDLEAAFYAAAGEVRQPHLDRLVALGVRPATIASIGASYPAFGIASGNIDRGGIFFPGDGPAHIVQPVAEGGELVDVVAWRSGNPMRWGLLTGLGWLLNGDACLSSRWDAGTIDLAASPLEWLRGGAVGGCVLDWDAPDLSVLRTFDRIRCGDAMLGATVRRHLTKPVRMPAVETKEARCAA